MLKVHTVMALKLKEYRGLVIVTVTVSAPWSPVAMISACHVCMRHGNLSWRLQQAATTTTTTTTIIINIMITIIITIITIIIYHVLA